MQRRSMIFLWFLFLGLSYPSLAQQDPWSKEAWEKRKLEIRSADDRFSMGFTGYLQPNAMFGYQPESGNKALDIKLDAARIIIYGTAFHPTLTYLFQTAWEKDYRQSTAKNTTSPYLRDFYFNLETHKHLQWRIGKFGMPFSRQSMAFATTLQFYEQNPSSNGFLLNENGKDVGVMVHNGLSTEPIEWAVAAVSNGLVARVGYNHNGIDGYRMSDFVGGPFRLGVGLSGSARMNYDSPNLDDIKWGLDFITKVSHFSVNGAFYHNFLREGKDTKHGFGAGVDMGYVMRDRYEPVVRYAWLKPAKNNGVEHEVRLGFNYYISGQHLRLQVYAGADMTVTAAKNSYNTWLGGAQFQFAL